MATFDPKHEAAEVVGQWSGVQWEDGAVLDLARGDASRSEQLLREHWKNSDSNHSDEEIAEIARWIAKLA